MGYYDIYLEHHGIKGQKWGVRRFETESGHLTPSGKARYDDYNETRNKTSEAKTSMKKAKSDYNSDPYNTSKQKAADNAIGMYNLMKRQEKNAKARLEMEIRKKEASKHEQKLAEKYKAEGMTDEEAALAAYKRAKLEKTLAIAGAVTVAAAGAYAAKKYHDYVTDEVLEVGKVKMKRVTTDNTNDLHDTFYAAFNRKDANKYAGAYAKQIQDNNMFMTLGGVKKADVYQKTIDLKENMKIASDKNAKDTMASVMKNASAEKRRSIIDELDDMNQQYQANPMLARTKQGKMLKKGLNDIANGKYDTKAAYDALNFNMSGGNQNAIYGDFKKALKDKGYSGIKDRNDNSYSGYDAKSARIIFDNSKVKVSDVRKLSDAEINTKFGKELGRQVAKVYAPKIAGYAAVAAGARAITNKSRDNKAIKEYKKEHPNTKLSNEEILENYYGGK